MDQFTWIAASIIGIVSAARVARFVIFDSFPPMYWLRVRLVALFPPDSKWKDLMECPFCLAPYIVAVSMTWFYVSDGHWSWWVGNGWWAASYVAAMIVAYDQPAD